MKIKDKVGRLYTNQFQTIHKATLRMTVWYYVSTDIQIDKGESRNRPIYTLSVDFQQKNAKVIQWTMDIERTRNSIAKG